MKKWIFLALTIFTYQKWDSISYFISPPPDYAAAHNGEVILYSAVWCSYCTKARKLLDKKGIAFFEYDIEKSTEGRMQYNELGGDGIPLLLINHKLVQGFDSSRIIELASADNL